MRQYVDGRLGPSRPRNSELNKEFREEAMQSKAVILAFAAAFSAAAVLPAGAQEATGRWVRPKGGTVQVTNSGGKLYGKIIDGKLAGFEMFNGMGKSGAGVWQGSAMKHPDMPGFMTFNGTVTISGDTMTVKGCAIGQSMCDAETWSRK
jgi:uncharacterized protein (DUF2147 family)